MPQKRYRMENVNLKEEKWICITPITEPEMRQLVYSILRGAGVLITGGVGYNPSTEMYPEQLCMSHLLVFHNYQAGRPFGSIRL